LNGLPADAAVLASKIVLAPALIAGVSVAGQRLGARLAGSLTALPVVAGPIAFFMALEHGPAFGSHAARGALAGELSLAVFCGVYAHACRRAPWLACLPLALAGFALATLALDAVGPSLALAAAAGIAVPLGAPRLLPDPEVAAGRRAITRSELALRMAAGATLVVAVTAAAGALGPSLAGLLTPFPIAATVLTVFSHRNQGAAFATQLLRGLLRGLLGMTAFFLVLALGLEPLGLAGAFALACAAALAVQAVLLARLRRGAGADDGVGDAVDEP
jgi:hypothetical protein